MPRSVNLRDTAQVTLSVSDEMVIPLTMMAIHAGGNNLADGLKMMVVNWLNNQRFEVPGKAEPMKYGEMAVSERVAAMEEMARRLGLNIDWGKNSLSKA